jgi:hypothetical protein
VKRAALYVLLVAGFTALASAQTTDLPPMNFLAESVREEGSAVQMNGNVRIAACSIVTAESATWRGSEIELGGKARMRLTNGVDRLKVQ